MYLSWAFPCSVQTDGKEDYWSFKLEIPGKYQIHFCDLEGSISGVPLIRQARAVETTFAVIGSHNQRFSRRNVPGMEQRNVEPFWKWTTSIGDLLISDFHRRFVSKKTISSFSLQKCNQSPLVSVLVRKLTGFMLIRPSTARWCRALWSGRMFGITVHEMNDSFASGRC